MAIKEVRALYCDGPKCSNYVEGNPEENSDDDLRAIARDKDWWMLIHDSIVREYQPPFMFCSDRCIKGFFVKKRKDEIAKAARDKQADEIEEALNKSNGIQYSDTDDGQISV